MNTSSISSFTQATSRSRLLVLFYFTIAGAYCLLFLFSVHAYLQDYPGWVYEGVVFHNKLVGGAALPYTFKTYPVPNSTITVLIAALSPLGFNAAAKLVIVAYIAVSSYLLF